MSAVCVIRFRDFDATRGEADRVPDVAPTLLCQFATRPAARSPPVPGSESCSRVKATKRKYSQVEYKRHFRLRSNPTHLVGSPVGDQQPRKGLLGPADISVTNHMLGAHVFARTASMRRTAHRQNRKKSKFCRSCRFWWSSDSSAFWWCASSLRCFTGAIIRRMIQE